MALQPGASALLESQRGANEISLLYSSVDHFYFYFFLLLITYPLTSYYLFF